MQRSGDGIGLNQRRFDNYFLLKERVKNTKKMMGLICFLLWALCFLGLIDLIILIFLTWRSFHGFA